MTLLEPAREVTGLQMPELDVARLGVVSFLNTQPIIYGLEGLKGVSMQPAPPSQLIDLLCRDEVDLALCSSVDLLQAPFDPAWLETAPLACDGPTRTVRLFSRRPLDRVTTIHCDTDSHTSVALLRVLLAEHWRIDPDIRPLERVCADVEAMLLIGDKVMRPEFTSDDWPVQIDLGAAWKDLTGLPFVFAVWMGRRDRQELLQRVCRVLDHQLRLNRHRLSEVVAARAGQLGWQSRDAHSYLSSSIRYHMGTAERAGLDAFLRRVRALGIGHNRSVPEPISP